MIKLTKQQACQFILIKQGLLGEYKFIGKDGVLEFITQAGCIQYDPVNVCGKNADLTLNARVKGYKKTFLEKLLYKERLLFDYPDKVLSILPINDWPYFSRYREKAKREGKYFEAITELEEWTKEYIKNNGKVSSNDLPLTGKAKWHSTIFWSGNWVNETNISRSVLEQLYSTGELIIHHKKGTRKYYDLTSKHLPLEILQTPEPLVADFEHQKWRILRRIGALGLIWDRRSDVWLNIWELNNLQRTKVIEALINEKKVIEIEIEGLKEIFYCRSEDKVIIDEVLQITKLKERCEFIAPLDPFMWDRKLIKTLFDFDYTWEIYTPQHKRKYGPYVMPILYRDMLIGRIELVSDRKNNTLIVKNIWYELGVRKTKKLEAIIEQRIKKHMRFESLKNYRFE